MLKGKIVDEAGSIVDKLCFTMWVNRWHVTITRCCNPVLTDLDYRCQKHHEDRPTNDNIYIIVSNYKVYRYILTTNLIFSRWRKYLEKKVHYFIQHYNNSFDKIVSFAERMVARYLIARHVSITIFVKLFVRILNFARQTA